MARPVHLAVDFDEEDWRRGDTWLREGVLSGYVTLRLNGVTILDWDVVGLNNSAISLLRSVVEDHAPATSATEDDARWPLFFCPGALRNRCGIIRDFRVTRQGRAVHLSEFHRCQVPADTQFSVPWQSWAKAVELLAARTLRRLPESKLGVRARHLPTYRRFRGELKDALRTARLALRSGVGA